MQTEHFELVAEIEQRHWWFVARREIVRSVLGVFVPAGEGRVVVDVGCATGGNVAAFARDYACCGIDTSADAIRLAQARFPDVPFICGQAPEDLGDRASRTDCYLLLDVLEHVEDDVGLLAPLVASLRPGGFVMITVPADERLWSPHDESMGHSRRYDVDRLRAVWAGLPVTECMTSHFCSRVYPIVRSVRAVARRTGRAWGRANSDMSIPAAPVNGLLKQVFRGEAERLARAARGTGPGYRRGVSLMAVLMREPGTDE